MTLFIVLKIIACISLLLLNLSLVVESISDLRKISLAKKKDRE